MPGQASAARHLDSSIWRHVSIPSAAVLQAAPATTKTTDQKSSARFMTCEYRMKGDVLRTTSKSQLSVGA